MLLLQKDRALEVIPVHRLYEEAAEKEDEPLDDEVIRRLLHWFKNDFFTWVNQPPCDSCGVHDTPIHMNKRIHLPFI